LFRVASTRHRDEVGLPSDLLAAAAFAALRAAVVSRRAAVLRLAASTRLGLRSRLALLAPLAATAATRILRTADAALALVLAATSVVAILLLAQVLQAHLQALAQQRASGHRSALAVAAALLLALPAALLLLPHRRPLRTFAALPLAALPALAAPVVAVVAVFVAQLLAALLQAFAHRLEALFGLLQAFAPCGARGRLAVRALRLLAFLGGGEREEQTEHEHQAFHGDHLRGRWKAASYAPRAATPTPPARRSCRAFVRADAVSMPRRCHGRRSTVPARGGAARPAASPDFSGWRRRRCRPAARRRRCAAR
jgi:hypothetical protein